MMKSIINWLRWDFRHCLVFMNQIVNKSNDQLIPYAGQVLPAAIMTKFDLQSGSNNKRKSSAR